MTTSPAFWNRISSRYAASPIRDVGAYEASLVRVRTYLGKTDTVLEVGAGTGSTALRLADCVARYTATDFSGGMIEIANAKLREDAPPGLRFEVARASDPIDGAPFDAVLAFNLLHLEPDLAGTLRALRDQLRPGGRLISKTPGLKGRFPGIKAMIRVMQFFGRAPFVAFFSDSELEDMISQAGFRIVETGDYPKRPASRFIVAEKL